MLSDSRPLVASARGDHNRTCPDRSLFRQGYFHRFGAAVPAPIALNPCRHQRNGHLRAELLCLIERSSRQRQTGNPCREAQVILDPGRSTRLAAQRLRIEHEDG